MTTEREPCPVELPPEFVELGFTGLFWLRTGIGDPEDPRWVEQVAKVPYIGPGNGWAVARIDLENNEIILVRKDMVAVAEALTRRGRFRDAEWVEKGMGQ